MPVEGKASFMETWPASKSIKHQAGSASEQVAIYVLFYGYCMRSLQYGPQVSM